MSEDNSHLKHKIQFVNSPNDTEPDTPVIAYTYNVVLSDAMLMFHICHLYHNCLILVDKGELKESEIHEYITLNYVLMSVQEALDNRIKCLSASYIDDNYKWCYGRPEIFDECLKYFSILKQELQDLLDETKQRKQNENVDSDRLCNQEETGN